MKTLKPVLLFLSLSIISPLSFAVDSSNREPTELFTAAYLFQVFGSLLLVIACLFGLMFLLRRVNRMGTDPAMPLAVLGSVNVGTREKVVLLKAGNEQLLIGVAQGSVRTLHVLEEAVVNEGEPLAETDQRKDFSALLNSVSPFGSNNK